MRTNLGKILPLFLVLILTSVALIGCAKETKITEEELIEKVAAAAKKIETSQFDMDMNMDLSGQMEGEEFKMSMSSKGKGSVDRANKETKMDMDMDMKMPKKAVEAGAPESVSMKMEMYLIGGTMYMKMAGIPGMPEQWIKRKMPEGYWEKAGVEQKVKLLKASEIKILGSEKVNGTDCYKVKVKPDLKKLWKTYMQRPGMKQIWQMPEEIKPWEMIKSTSYKEWFSKENFFSRKTKMQMTMEISSEDVPEAEKEFEMTYDIAMDGLTHDYNKPVSIELPPKAKEAPEMPQKP